MSRSPLLTGAATLLLAACSTTPSNRVLAAEIEAEARQMMATYDVGGLAMAVVLEDQVVWSGGLGSQGGEAGEYGPETACGMFSATKVLSSLAVSRLAAQGRLDLSTPLGELRPDLPEAWQGIPMWRLLNHTSGITTLFDKSEFQSWEGETMSDEDVLAVVSQYPLDYAPGEFSRYRQSGYGVFVALVSGQLGMPWSEVIESEVCRPAGMKGTVHREIAGGSVVEPMLAAAGNYLTTSADMERLFLSLNDHGAGLAADDWMRELRVPERITVDYGLGAIRSESGGEETWGHPGGGARANVRYAPESRVGVAVFTDEPNNYGLAVELTDKIFARILGDVPFPRSKEPVAIALKRVRRGPVASMVEAYQAGKLDGPESLQMAQAESALNDLGYYLMGEGRGEDSLVIFELNAAEHPLSANVHDSLGEAHLALGHREQALASYRRAVELDPSSTGAIQAVKDLEAR